MAWRGGERAGGERERPGLVRPGEEKAKGGVYCCLQLSSGECRKNGPRLILEEQQLKDKRQWTQIATREILVRYEEFTPGIATFSCQRKLFLSPCNAQSEVPSPVSSVMIRTHTFVSS